MRDISPVLTLWDDATIRQLVQMVKVESSERIEITLKSGEIIRQRVENTIRKRRQ